MRERGGGRSAARLSIALCCLCILVTSVHAVPKRPGSHEDFKAEHRRGRVLLEQDPTTTSDDSCQPKTYPKDGKLRVVRFDAARRANAR